MELVRFEELEKKIRKIVRQHDLLAEENAELKELLEHTKRELSEARVSVQSFEGERLLVRKKVDLLLQKLENILVAG